MDVKTKRRSRIERKTKETNIEIIVDLDDCLTESEVETGIGFFDHMLFSFLKNAGIYSKIQAEGDLYVDFHHVVEDIGIVLGTAINEALLDKRGIRRYSSIILPMDESLILVSVDISGRGALYFDVEFKTEKIGNFDTELVKEFMNAFATNLGATIHMRKICGENSHHIAEACFKGMGRTLREALEINPKSYNKIPSTKGSL